MTDHYRDIDFFDFDEDIYESRERELVRRIERDFRQGTYGSRHRMPVFQSASRRNILGQSASRRNMLGLATYNISDLATICSAQLCLEVFNGLVIARVRAVEDEDSELLMDGIAHMSDGDMLREIIHPELSAVVGYTAIVDGGKDASELFATTSDGQEHRLPAASPAAVCDIAQRVREALLDGARAEYPPDRSL